MNAESNLARNAYLRCTIFGGAHQYGAARHLGAYRENGPSNADRLPRPYLELNRSNPDPRGSISIVHYCAASTM